MIGVYKYFWKFHFSNNPLKTKRRLLYLKPQFTQLTLIISVIKTNQLALYRAKVAICSAINTKHTTTVWQNVKFVNVKPVGALHNR